MDAYQVTQLTFGVNSWQAFAVKQRLACAGAVLKSVIPSTDKMNQLYRNGVPEEEIHSMYVLARRAVDRWK